MEWKTSRRTISIDRPQVMGIINTTPDSFSDGGVAFAPDDALRRAEKLIADGADILDIGGESTRPGSSRVDEREEIRRVVPVIEAITKRFEVPISVDTSKSAVAKAAVAAGAEIINDISGLRFDEDIADIAAQHHTGLVLMHSRGTFEEMHRQEPVADIIAEVKADFRRAISTAEDRGVGPENIVLDVGIGFGKAVEHNLELIARLPELIEKFPQYPMLVGTSRKSFISKLLGDVPVDDRLAGSLATLSIAVWNGASIVRVHDVKETVGAIHILKSLLATT